MIKFSFFGISLIAHLFIISAVKVKNLFKRDFFKIASLATFVITASLIGTNFYLTGIQGVVESGFVNKELIGGLFNKSEKFEPDLAAKNKVILRIDDVQAFTWRDVLIKMVNDALNRQVPVTLGVIPTGLTEDRKLTDFLERVKDNIEIAQHGYEHNLAGVDAAEFGSLDEQEADQRIKKGQAILEKITNRPPLTFIPPHNLISSASMIALEKNGFRILSSEGEGYFDYTVSTYDFGSQELIPVSQIINSCQQEFEKKDLCVIAIHPQDYSSEENFNQEKYQHYLALLDSLEEMGVSFVRFKDLIKPKIVSANLVFWDQSRGIKSITENVETFSEISPYWYTLTSQGKIAAYSDGQKLYEDKELVELLHSHNILVIPTITNAHNGIWDGEQVSNLLNDKELMTKHIDNIVKLVISKDYDGIDIDYENLSPEDRKIFSIFIKKLADALEAKKRKLTVNLTAKVSDEKTGWTPDAQDWSVIGQYADEVRIMAYDYHSVSSRPGPIAPIDWVEDVLEYATKKIPGHKIIVGIPLYGYDWSEESADSLAWEETVKLGNRALLDEEKQSVWFEYVKDGVYRQAWFENATTTAAKLKLIKNFHLGGINFWRLGGEDPNTWPIVNELHKTEGLN